MAEKDSNVIEIKSTVSIDEDIPKFTYKQERQLLKKVDFRLMPLLILLYLCKNLDVNNASYLTTLNVKTSKNILVELKMTSNEWAWVSTLYFIPFVIFEIPSTILMKKSTPRVHQFRIAFLWGATTAIQAAVKNKGGLYALRFLLGLFEAGMFPAALAHLTYYYRPDEVTTRMAFLGVLGSFSSILTAFITYGFSFAKGLSPWRWVFLIEGIFTVLCSFLMLFFLPNFPDTAKWLTDDERKFLVARLPPASPKSTDDDFNINDTLRAFKNPTLILFAFLRLFQSLGTYGLSFWLPTIIQKFGITSSAKSPLLSVPSAAVSVISGILFSYAVDRTIVQPQLVVIFALTASFAAFLVLTLVRNIAVLYTFIIFATLSASADGSVLSSWLNQTVGGATQVGFALAFTNSVGQLGGIIGPQMFRSRYSPRYTVPYAICLAFIGLGLVVTLILWYLTKEIVSETFYDRKEKLKEKKASLDEFPIYKHWISKTE